MKKMILCLLLLSFAISLGAQSPAHRLLQYIKARRYDQAFSYGSSQIRALQQKNLMSYNLELLTWTALSLRENPNGAEGCRIMGRYLDYHKKGLSQIGKYTPFTQLHQNICKGNKYDLSMLDNIPDFNTAVAHEHERSAGYITHFKTYLYLKSAAELDGFLQESFQKIVRESSSQAKKEIVRPPLDTFTLKTVQKGASDIVAYLKRVYPERQYVIGTNFIIVSRNTDSRAVKVTLRLMEKTLAYYRNQFAFPLLPDYITIFLSDDDEEVRSDISKIYGINVPGKVLGFSDVATASIVAWIPGMDKIGTLKHELIHLYFRNQFMLAPEWMEEGLATLFEESRFKDSTLVGVGNWRGNLLFSLSGWGDSIPDLLFEKMVLNEDNGYASVRSLLEAKMANIRGVARINMTRHSMPFDSAIASDLTARFIDNFLRLSEDAIVRYILLYMQQKEKLNKLMMLIKENDNIALEGGSILDTKELFVTATEAASFQAFKQDFLEWLKHAPKDNRQQ